MTSRKIAVVLFASALAAAAWAGPGAHGGDGGGGMGGGAPSMPAGAMSPRPSPTLGVRHDAEHRADATARDDAAVRRDAGLAQADASKREPPEQAVGFWTRARRFFGFSKSTEAQSPTANEHQQATENRPVGS